MKIIAQISDGDFMLSNVSEEDKKFLEQIGYKLHFKDKVDDKCEEWIVNPDFFEVDNNITHFFELEELSDEMKTLLKEAGYVLCNEIAKIWCYMYRIKSVYFDGSISEKRIKSAVKCLVNNGIDKDEAKTVLQAVGFILLDLDLFREDDGEEK